MQNNPYVAEFLVVLQEQYNLTIMETQNVDVAKQKRNQKKKQKKKVPYSYYNDSDFTIPPYVYSKNTGLFLDDIELTDFALLRPQHANDLSQLFQQFIHNHCDNITSAASSGNNNGGIQLGGCIAGKSNNYHPKISILNRSTQSKRSILNVDQLLEEIIQSFPNSTVRVEYFEDNKTMIQQAQFFMESDIILSPHGAQLTGIIHQPSYDGCSQIVELLPQDYLVADYFGSLAKAAGVHHSFFYIQTDKRVNDTSTLLEHELPDPYGQHKYHYYASSDYRNYQMCPTTTKLMASMQILVKNWQSCCRSQEM